MVSNVAEGLVASTSVAMVTQLFRDDSHVLWKETDACRSGKQHGSVASRCIPGETQR